MAKRYIQITIGEDEFGMGGTTDTYAVDTDAEVDAARAALTDAGIERASIWTGEPGTPDAYRTNSILWAAARRIS